jgi:hypothetical protein
MNLVRACRLSIEPYPSMGEGWEGVMFPTAQVGA